MNFGQALEAIKLGQKLLGIYPEGTVINYRTANGEIAPWVATQSDLLEDDWFLLES